MSVMNRSLLQAVLLSGLATAAGANAAFAGEPLKIGGHRQLLLDDYVIAERINVRREFNQVKKLESNPIIKCDKPWETGEGGYIERMTLLHDEKEGLLKMWYEGWRTYHDRGEERVLGYATSKDGLQWEKPNLGLVQYEGSKDNNLVPMTEGDRHGPRFVELDPNEKDPTRRYKNLMWGPNRNWIPKYSADGFNWKSDPSSLTGMTYEDDCIPATWDPQADRWVFYRRVRKEESKVTAGKGPYSNRIIRLAGISVSEGPTIEKWHPKTKSYVPFLPDELDAAEAKRIGALWGEFYSMIGWPHQGIWLGGVECLWRTVDYVDESGRLSTVDGPENMHLVWSRDLISWQRKNDRVPLIPLGPPGAWDSGMIYGMARPVAMGDELWIYYDAFDCHHYCPSWFGDVPRFKAIEAKGAAKGKVPLHSHPWNAKTAAIGLAKLRLDGYAHLESDDVTGIVTTKPLVFSGKGLGINAAADGGQIRVEILDEAGQPIAGFSRDDSDPIVGDSVRHTATWEGGAPDDLSPLKGRVVQLRFVMNRAKLYSFWFIDGGESSPSPAQRVSDALEALPGAS